MTTPGAWAGERASVRTRGCGETESDEFRSGPQAPLPPKGVNMSAAAVRILVVGAPTESTETTLRGLARAGWESHAVKSVREADTVLRTIRFQLTFATEKLPDGTGYELAALIAQQYGNLFISVPLSETCLWLPAVENGVRSLGQRALNPLTLAKEAELILRTTDGGIARSEGERNGGGVSSGEVIRAEAVAVNAAARFMETDRFGRQAREGYERGEEVTSRRPIGSRRQVMPGVGGSPEHPAPLVREGALPDLGALGKRWRGF